jgi:hypothetical protein
LSVCLTDKTKQQKNKSKQTKNKNNWKNKKRFKKNQQKTKQNLTSIITSTDEDQGTITYIIMLC